MDYVAELSISETIFSRIHCMLLVIEIFILFSRHMVFPQLAFKSVLYNDRIENGSTQYIILPTRTFA